MDGNLFWIWLSLRVTPGSDTFPKLLKEFPCLYDIYEADRDRLEEALGVGAKDLAKLADKNDERSRAVLRECEAKQISLVPYDSERYPSALKAIDSPPVLLYCKGELPDLDRSLVISVVGTRKMTGYGKRMTFEIARDLAKAGAVVVSGMARGIDGVANAAAINAGGKTVAVLGSGIDVIYPREHEKLAMQIAKHGAVVTEFPPRTRPLPENFPIRNRIISGLAHATAVMEADLNSGSLITARLAKRQGKILYALPGHVNEPGGEGTAMLLRDGARVVACADHIIDDFEKLYPERVNIFKLLDQPDPVVDPVLSAMGVDARTGRT